VSYFPWVGITLGELSLSNAEGFGEAPFARIDSANVKVELMPLLRKEVNVKTVELKGLNMDLQRAADGTTNWDDLSQRSPTTTVTIEDDTTTEVEGDAAAIAALAVGGVEVANANISWLDKQSGTDAQLTDFALKTGRIELAKPFNLNTSFNVASNSIGLAANVNGGGDFTIDLDQQRYTLSDFTLDTDAKGATLPGGALGLSLASNITADLAAQTVNADAVSLSVLGITLKGDAAVSDLDAEPKIVAQLASDIFNPSEILTKLGIEPPVTADPAVLQSGNLSLTLNATPAAAKLNELTIQLDDTTFNGAASLPNLAAALPPVRFDFNVDSIDLDRYLPPSSDAPTGDSGSTTTDAGAGGSSDTPIELPNELIRQLDVDGIFSVSNLKVMNLTTQNIKVPMLAKGGVITFKDISASLYQGSLASTMTIDARQDTPLYVIAADLAKVESEPLLVDLQQKDSLISGNANFAAALSTSGNSVNALKAGLNGDVDAAFLDGSINGVNIGYQLRRAKAALVTKTLPDEEKHIKTDFSSLSISGDFVNGVFNSNDLDMRSPLLRLAGGGSVDLTQDYIDYTPNLKVTGTVEGQGGKDLEDLKGLLLEIPIRGTFGDLSADFTGLLLAALKENLLGNIKARAKEEAEKLKAKAKAEADKLKAQAKAELKAKEAQARARLKAEEEAVRAKLEAEEAAARARFEAEEAELRAKLDSEKARAKDKFKKGLQGLLK